MSEAPPRRPAPRPGPDDEEIRGSVEGRRIAAELRHRIFGTTPPIVSIGPYRIARRIGQGGMGTVYAAVHEPSGRQRAIKWVPLARGAAWARLEREAKAMLTLSHPNVVAVDDFGACDGGWYLAMDLVDGSNLRHWLRAGRSREAIVDCIAQTADGLAHAHGHGIIHRDIKPDNLLVAADGTLRITDFGLARAMSGSTADEQSAFEERLTRTGASPGTVGYMAPEQLLARPVTPAIDQFALAATAFEALYGRPAFAGATADLVGLAILEGNVCPIDERAGNPDSVHDAIIRALAVDPEDRHADIAAFGRALRGVPDPSPRGRSWRSRLFRQR